VLPHDEFRVPVDGRAEMRCRVRGECGLLNDEQNHLGHAASQIDTSLFAAPLDWSHLPTCQILMMSKWNNVFDLVLGCVWVGSKVRERKQRPEPRLQITALYEKERKKERKKEKEKKKKRNSHQHGALVYRQ
jgi:hypothetical protein